MLQRRKFSAEFKRGTVELMRRPQVAVSQVAQKLGVDSDILSRWRREPTHHGKAFTGAGVPRSCGSGITRPVSMATRQPALAQSKVILSRAHRRANAIPRG